MLSKKQVKRAGEVLAKNPKDAEAMAVLSEWRSLHAHPINTFQAMLRNKKGLKNATIVQRLKRTPSIIRKIQRFEGMNLARMQDIGGIRVILPNIKDVYKLHDSLIHGKHQHEPVLPPKDYILYPKDDGYRSLHQVFKYNSHKGELKGLQIELQIRTRIQHYWATAVETLGLIEKASFKTGEGSEEYKRFFKLASALFSHYEASRVLEEFQDISISDIVDEFVQLEGRLQAFSKLKGLLVTGSHISSVKTKGEFYYLMELNTQEKTVSLTPFEKRQLRHAENMYQLLEMQNVDNPHIELVLISAKSFKDVKRAYPNYFLDTQSFIESLEKICQKYKKV
ncbi:RelA/SpoT domain-containing protein [Moraxella oculi]|uniref:RelA/SpoT domain-containing protein n=1 Tax=Moraxella oculi TaxID=2940516 RepID=A0ABW8U702_9GAMM